MALHTDKISSASIAPTTEAKPQNNPIEALLIEASKAYLVPSHAMIFSFEDQGRYSLSITKIFKMLFDNMTESWDFLADKTKITLIDALTNYLNPANANKFAPQTYPPALFPQSFIAFLDRLEPAQRSELSRHWLELIWKLTACSRLGNPGETRIFPTNLTAIIKAVVKAIQPDKLAGFISEIAPEILVMADDKQVESGGTYTTKNGAHENYKIRKKIIEELFNHYNIDVQAHCLKFYEVCNETSVWKNDLLVRETKEEKNKGNEMLNKSEEDLISIVKQIPDPGLYVKSHLGSTFCIFRRHVDNLKDIATKARLKEEINDVTPKLTESRRVI